MGVGVSWYLWVGGGGGGKGGVRDLCAFYAWLASRHSPSTTIHFVTGKELWHSPSKAVTFGAGGWVEDWRRSKERGGGGGGGS